MEQRSVRNISIQTNQPTIVCIKSGADKTAAMLELIVAADLIRSIEQEWKVSGKTKESFLVVIKPAFGIDKHATDCLVDAELLSLCAGQIKQAGFSNTIVTQARANKNTAEVEFDFGSFLGKYLVEKSWYDADFRISFAKNQTDSRNFYTGCISTVGSDRGWKRIHSNGKKARQPEFAVLFADRLKVHFGFVDAWISFDGNSGSRQKQTQTLMASSNILALDWVMGEKMNLNPGFNPVMQEAMHRWGVTKIVRQGNMTPWENWENPSILSVTLKNLF
ncbi:DUF362 domain-containing protein [Ferruginibacter paludis]|uniref:DUF362 domain-containing protein n=1 Tax=Ferruginibacter paludis TaxID=1310417 RepID=UPI0025B36393|nr:DUF362 domain-containing protein [Ferruginibacter paludis]MDN3657854.1 DUF362 domain-containing protein [Ferruginibacter paludis]